VVFLMVYLLSGWRYWRYRKGSGPAAAASAGPAAG
jgi:hypothetical protein